MVLTPQLLQAIKLLQLPNFELTSFIEAELERNPLLERAEDSRDPSRQPRPCRPIPRPPIGRARPCRTRPPISPATSAPRSTTCSTPTAPAARPNSARRRWPGLAGGQWSGAAAAAPEDAADIEAYVAAQELALASFSPRQTSVALADPGDRLIAAALIDGLDEAGYFRGDLAEFADRCSGRSRSGSSACSASARRWSRPASSPATSPNA